MNLWTLLTLDFIIQEPVSSSALILQAYQHHYSLVVIHILFSLATIFDIVVGFYLGRLLHNYFKHHRISSFIKRNIDSLTTSIGKYGKIISLIVFVPLIFPVSAFVLPWFDVTLTEAIVYVFIGEWIFWYLPEWLLVLTAKSFVANSQHAIYVVIILSLVMTACVRFFLKKRKRSKRI